MSLLDFFRRPRDSAPPPAPSVDEWLARGRLEAEVGSLRLEWTNYKDQLNKLVQRLEKREQRAAARETPPPESENGHASEYDEVEALRQLRARRRRN